MKSEYGDALYYMQVCWLGCGQMLRHMYDLKSEIELFQEMKGKHFPQLCDHDYMCTSH